MKKLLNILYVTTPEAYLTLEGENVVVRCEGNELGRMPLHNLEAILSFNYPGASPALMGACAERNIDLCFFTPANRFSRARSRLRARQPRPAPRAVRLGEGYRKMPEGRAVFHHRQDF